MLPNCKHVLSCIAVVFIPCQDLKILFLIVSDAYNK